MRTNMVNYATNFPGFWHDYTAMKHGDNIETYQHEQMAAHYIQTIADVMKAYDTASQTDQFYRDLAWEGLKGTTAWNNLSSNERQRINTNIQNYIVANNNDGCA